jgi:glycine/D-amino acid oxidase-like deaminating enzyme
MVTGKRMPHVAVLGAGIMGSCLALFLARKGIAVTLFDSEAAPMSGASRWNEGKIHLGYLYGADTELSTARRLIPGGIAFGPLMSSLLQENLANYITPQDETFLIHRDSVIGSGQARHHYHAVSELLRSAPGAGDYLVDVRNAACEELSQRELSAIADPEFVSAGFRVPERSVQTNWIADRICAALAAQVGISRRMETRVLGANPIDSNDGRWRVSSNDGAEDFDYVFNALSQNRMGIDKTAGVHEPLEWSKRYRLAMFVRTTEEITTAGAVLAVGPFGDIKNYNGRDFYLSWYPAGLVHASDNTTPVTDFKPTNLDREAIIAATWQGLNGILTGIDDIRDRASGTRLAGGWVFAQGRGSLADPGSSLHRRDLFGVCRVGRYYSVDTGKFSLAPWMAASLADEIAGK